MSRGAAARKALPAPSRGSASSFPRKRESNVPTADIYAYRRRRFWLFVALVVYLGAMGIARVHVQALVAEASLEVSSKDARLQQLLLENEKLKVESVTLRSPARIERYALKRLGMVRPDQVHYITVDTPARHVARGSVKLVASK